MESEDFEVISQIFNQIDIEIESGSEKYDLYSYQPKNYHYVLKHQLPRRQLQYVDFELYIKEKCENKIQILDRKTFHQIKRPILICFHHFREKCAYTSKWLDRIYQLSLKYGDRIEFIVANMYDTDLLYPGRNPINFYCRLVAVENQCPNVYAINEKKLIYEHYDAHHSLENLSELCENFLSGKLYPSQPLPPDNDGKLIKICVHDNFEELIMNSKKNIFLIINLFKYQIDDLNYENVALALKGYNVDIVYMEAEENYIPFEYGAYCYPTILFIPFNDKQNFIYYQDCRTEEFITEFLKKCLEDLEYLPLIQQQHKASVECKNVKVPIDFSLDLTDLPQFLKTHYEDSIRLFDHDIIFKTKRCSLLVFMHFPGKCLAQHVEWFNKLYQVVENCDLCHLFVADFKDINVIHSKWQAKDLTVKSQGKPRIYGFDRFKNIYEFGNFQHPASLFYFTNELIDGELFYSQLYDRNMANDLVKNWTAYYFKRYLRKLKKHIFITFYTSEDQEKNEQLFELLKEISKDVKELNVEVVKFDVKFNYLSLEYQQPKYPVHYFIPKNNKKRYETLYR
ncbi:uncharacterized protein ACRADG_006586 [Cochliomyia hominivorax]